jgi:hypothetical protein
MTSLILSLAELLQNQATVDGLKKLGGKIYPLVRENGTLTGLAMASCGAFCESKIYTGLPKAVFCTLTCGASAALLGTCGYTAAKAAYVVLKPYAISYGKKVMTTLF